MKQISQQIIQHQHNYVWYGCESKLSLRSEMCSVTGVFIDAHSTKFSRYLSELPRHTTGIRELKIRPYNLREDTMLYLQTNKSTHTHSFSFTLTGTDHTHTQPLYASIHIQHTYNVGAAAVLTRRPEGMKVKDKDREKERGRKRQALCLQFNLALMKDKMNSYSKCLHATFRNIMNTRRKAENL